MRGATPGGTPRVAPWVLFRAAPGTVFRAIPGALWGTAPGALPRAIPGALYRAIPGRLPRAAPGTLYWRHTPPRGAGRESGRYSLLVSTTFRLMLTSGESSWQK
jgi:hypothetical protein